MKSSTILCETEVKHIEGSHPVEKEDSMLLYRNTILCGRWTLNDNHVTFHNQQGYDGPEVLVFSTDATQMRELDHTDYVLPTNLTGDQSEDTIRLMQLYAPMRYRGTLLKKIKHSDEQCIADFGNHFYLSYDHCL